MTIAREFQYFKPATLDEAVEILTKYTSKARILAGGTDLIALIQSDLLAPDALVDIKGIAGLKEIKLKDNTLAIGALVTFHQLIQSEIIQEKFPLILEMARKVGSTGLRNRATIVGNICSAVPWCDSGPVLLVYEAQVLVTGSKGERKIALQEWFLGSKETALKEGEIATSLVIPVPEDSHAGCYVKLRRYRGSDLALASVAVIAFPMHSYRIAFGALTPKPVRAKNIEALIEGKKLTDGSIAEVNKLVSQEISPITDIRATKEYRMHMVKLMLAKAIKTATARLSGNGPAYGTEPI